MEKALMEVDRVREIIGKYMLADGLDMVLDLDRSEGARLFDSKRNEFFIDFFGFFATNALGMNHPRLNRPEVRAELGRVALHKPTNSDIYSREMAEFVEVFSRVAKSSYMKYLFFIEGGTLGVENALKAAFDWKVRKNFAKGIREEKGYQAIHFHQAFHGRSGYTLSLTNTSDPRKTQYFPTFRWPRILNPKCTFPLEGANLDAVREAEITAVSEIEAAIARDPDDMACIIIEPIQSEGGDNHFRPEFHQKLRQICDEHEMLLIHDEVQTGFGVTGRFWCGEHYVQPDLLAFGKKSQVCGMMAGPRIDEIEDNVFHVPSRINSTWGGNLVDMVRSRMQLEIYEKEDIVEGAARTGTLLMGELRRLGEEFPEKVSNIRGLGLLCAMDFQDTETRDRFRKKLFDERVIMLGCGPSSVRFRMPLTITPEELQEGLSRVRKVLADL